MFSFPSPQSPALKRFVQRISKWEYSIHSCFPKPQRAATLRILYSRCRRMAEHTFRPALLVHVWDAEERSTTAFCGIDMPKFAITPGSVEYLSAGSICPECLARVKSEVSGELSGDGSE